MSRTADPPTQGTPVPDPVVGVRAPPTADLCEDRGWLMGYRGAEPRALERVFRTYAPLAYHVVRVGFARGAGGRARLSAADEDDVVQETFIRLFSASARERYDGVRPFGALVRVVTRNALVDHLRKQGRAELVPTHELDADAGATPEWTPDQPLPEEEAVSVEEQRLARAFVDGLPARERDLLALRFEQRLTQAQAGAALGLSRQNVRTMEGRLHRKIKDFLKTLR